MLRVTVEYPLGALDSGGIWEWTMEFSSFPVLADEVRYVQKIEANHEELIFIRNNISNIPFPTSLISNSVVSNRPGVPFIPHDVNWKMGDFVTWYGDHARFIANFLSQLSTSGAIRRHWENMQELKKIP